MSFGNFTMPEPSLPTPPREDEGDNRRDVLHGCTVATTQDARSRQACRVRRDEETLLREAACIVCDIGVTSGGRVATRLLQVLTDANFPYARFAKELDTLESCRQVRDQLLVEALR